MAFATARSLALKGADGHVIDVQVDVSPGLVNTTIVGRVDKSLSEARDRVRMAINNDCGRWPATKRVTILLAPAAVAQTTPAAGAARIAEHMEVVGADGAHVGTVDKVENGTIVLAETDRDAGGRHHAVPIAWIGTVDGKVLLTKPAAEAKAQWDRADKPTDGPKR